MSIVSSEIGERVRTHEYFPSKTADVASMLFIGHNHEVGGAVTVIENSLEDFTPIVCLNSTEMGVDGHLESKDAT